MAARHRSRRRALQVLFEWDMRGGLVDQAIAHYYETLYSEPNEDAERPEHDAFMEELVRGAVENVEAIDKKIEGKSENWRIARMPAVDRNILRLAIFELSQDLLPAPVIID